MVDGGTSESGAEADEIVILHAPKRLRSVGEHYADALVASRQRAAATGALVVHAYDQAEVLAGQGTVARELEEQAPGLDTVLVAVGGGGLVGGTANAIAPGKRMLSSMTPAILTKGGKLALVTGSPGGSTIITSVLQSILSVVDYGANAEQAVSAPRLHHQWLPDPRISAI